MTTSDELTFAADNPDLANLAAQVASETDPPKVEEPEDGPVELPGGFVRFVGATLDPEEVRTAWVRELTGYDEERVAKARNKRSLSAVIDALLVGGVTDLGDQKPTVRELQDLLSGDREYLLLEISRATYGDLLEYEDFVCEHCHESFSFSFSKSQDIPVKRMESPSDGEFEVTLRRGRTAKVRLSTGKEASASEKGTTPAEVNTILLRYCVLEIREKDGSVIDVTQLPTAVSTKLGVVDRQTILEEIAKRSPGPQFDGVSVPHDSCGNESKVFVTLADLFRGM